MREGVENPMIASRDEGVSPQSWNRSSTRRAPRWAPSEHEALEAALEGTRDWLLERQDDEGYWVAELEGDTILESEYILLMTFLGREKDAVCARCARYIQDHQMPEGGWAIYPGGPVDVSASVKAYFALKLTGRSPDEPEMARARRAILEAGGAHACNSFTRFYLALLGQIDYDECPCVPPELILVPPRWRFSLSAMSAWTRTIVVPLSIMSYYKPARSLAPEQGIGELFATERRARTRGRLVSWTRFFLGLDRVLKWLDRRVPASWRRPAIRAAHRWVMEHCEETDGLGAIFPPMVYAIIALKCLGYDDQSPEVRWAIEQLDDLHIVEDDRIRVQPCVSPVWDTAIATIALADAALPAEHPAWGRAVDWLLARELRAPGDWAINGPRVEPTGWHFQFRNKFYPDLDDSAMVMLALARSPLADHPAVVAASRRGLDWLLSMQNRDGGWAAYERRHRQLEVLPPSSPSPTTMRCSTRKAVRDITARTSSSCWAPGAARPTSPAVRRGPGPPGTPRNPRVAGTAAGASTTSTAPGRSSRAWRRSASRWTSPKGSSGPSSGNSESTSSLTGAGGRDLPQL